MREDVTSVSSTWRLWCGWREVWVGTGVSLITYTSGNECRRVEKSSLAELEERAWGTAPMGAPRGAEARTAVPRASRCIRRVSRMERVVKDRGRGVVSRYSGSPPAPSRVAAARDGVELSSSKKVGENFRGRVRRGPARAYRVAGSGDAGGGRAGALRRSRRGARPRVRLRRSWRWGRVRVNHRANRFLWRAVLVHGWNPVVDGTPGRRVAGCDATSTNAPRSPYRVDALVKGGGVGSEMGVPFHARRPAPSRRLPPASSSFSVATREVVSEAPAMAWRGAGRRRPRRRRAPPRATDPREGPRGRHPPRRAPRTSCRARQSDDRGRIIHPRSTRVLAPFSSSGGGEGAVSRRGCAYRDRGRHAPGPAANARLEATGAVRAFLPPAPPPALGAGPVTTRPNSREIETKRNFPPLAKSRPTSASWFPSRF